MPKRIINLLIEKQQEPLLYRRLKIILPVSAVVFLLIFLILYFVSISYLRSNSSDFNQMKAKLVSLEQKISAQKNTEGIYTLSAVKLDLINQILTKNPSLTNVIAEIVGLPIEGVDIKYVSIEKNGDINFLLETYSIDTLETFINLLLKKEEQKIFSSIQAGNVIRDKKGMYALGISLKINPILLK